LNVLGFHVEGLVVASATVSISFVPNKACRSVYCLLLVAEDDEPIEIPMRAFDIGFVAGEDVKESDSAVFDPSPFFEGVVVVVATTLPDRSVLIDSTDVKLFGVVSALPLASERCINPDRLRGGSGTSSSVKTSIALSSLLSSLGAPSCLSSSTSPTSDSAARELTDI
jgi:hypothetical protein